MIQLIFFFCSTGVWTQGLHFEPLHQPFLVMGFYQDTVSKTICPGWLLISILQISASWVAGIAGVNHWCPVN
jgi:hypothetical protein